MAKKLIIIFVSIVVIGGLILGLYWKQMSNAEKWLLFNKNVALQYSKQLLAIQPTQNVPNELIDMHISTKAGIVTFDSSNQDRYFVIAYSPYRAPAPINFKEQTISWKELESNWYELLIPTRAFNRVQN